MSMPEIPKPDSCLTRDGAIAMILASIAAEETALGCILQTEEEKLRYVLERLRREDRASAEEVQLLLALSNSAAQILDSATGSQIILKGKMERALEYLTKPCPPVCPPVHPPVPPPRHSPIIPMPCPECHEEGCLEEIFPPEGFPHPISPPHCHRPMLPMLDPAACGCEQLCYARLRTQAETLWESGAFLSWEEAEVNCAFPAPAEDDAAAVLLPGGKRFLLVLSLRFAPLLGATPLEAALELTPEVGVTTVYPFAAPDGYLTIRGGLTLGPLAGPGTLRLRLLSPAARTLEEGSLHLLQI
ncbi:MAG: hypothetical protein LBJ11_00360 [Oscillospiraceae bacterium]|jgi:hypothetical protein|nr:hypothetical protein [Oscillospiraceae bacterium]